MISTKKIVKITSKFVKRTILFFRYLDPDTSVLMSELKSTTNKKFHKLNKALCSLVGIIH